MSIRELFSLATIVAEAVAVEKQRELVVPSPSKSSPKVVPVTNSLVITSLARSVTSKVNCSRCGGIGHMQRNCPSTPVRSMSVPRDQGNASGVRPKQLGRLEPGRQNKPSQ